MGLLGVRSRPRTSAPARVTFVELFFDLMFVFAITQISHALRSHFTPLGMVETLLLMMAVWWVWIFTSWIAHWLDPYRTVVCLIPVALMLAGLVLSTSLPKAFETRGLAFAGAYVVMQVGCSLFTVWVVRHAPRFKPTLGASRARLPAGFRPTRP